MKTSDDMCYTMCKQLLDVVKETGNVLFLTNFVLNHLSSKMSDKTSDNYKCLNMGAKVRILPFPTYHFGSLILSI